jgi:hypothetical protein
MDHNFSLIPLWYFIGLPLFAKLNRDFHGFPARLGQVNHPIPAWAVFTASSSAKAARSDLSGHMS